MLTGIKKVLWDRAYNQTAAGHANRMAANKRWQKNHPQQNSRIQTRWQTGRNHLSKKTATMHGDRWSEIEDSFLLNFKGTNFLAAQELGRTWSACKNRLRRLRKEDNHDTR